MQWYIKKIRHTQPELLDYNEVWLRAWMADMLVQQEDEDAMARLDDVIKELEEYYGTDIEHMSKRQLLSVTAWVMKAMGI